jgi:hypothetical protein
MVAKLIRAVYCTLALTSSLCYSDNSARKPYTDIQYLKNYGLSSCLADGYQSKDIVHDAVAAANGYKELGSLDIDAYNEVSVLGKKFLSRNYLSLSGEKLTLMKCIDFFYSKELDDLAQKYIPQK